MALQCGAFHITTAGKTYFNTTPLGRAVTGTLLVRAMHDDGVDVWGDGSHLQGQRHRALLPLRPARQPDAAHLQAVARPRLRRRARRPRRDERVPRRPRPAVPRPRRRRRTRPTPTSGAPPTRPSRSRSWPRAWTSSSRSWASPTGTPRWRSRPRTSRSAFEEGWPVAINGDEFADAGRRSCRRPTPSAAATASGMSDQIENRIIEAKSRGIYEAPGPGAAAHRLRAPRHRRSTTRARSRTTARWAAASAACCTRAAGSTRRA